jgi:hypothetical protein
MLRIPVTVTDRGSILLEGDKEIHDINEILDRFVDERSEIAFVMLYAPWGHEVQPMKGYQFMWQGRFINIRNPYSYDQAVLFKTLGKFLIECFTLLTGYYSKDDLYCSFSN